MENRKQTKQELEELRHEMALRNKKPSHIDQLVSEMETGNLAAIYKREHDALENADAQLEKLRIQGSSRQIEQLEEARERFAMRVQLIDTVAENAVNSNEQTWFDTKMGTIAMTLLIVAVVAASIINL